MEEQSGTTVIIEHAQALETALAGWQNWPENMCVQSAPEVIAPLGIDSSNHCYLVDFGGRTVVARLRAQSGAALKLDPSTEWHAHSQAWGAGLAPEPLYYQSDLHLFISHYHAPDASDAIDTPETIATLLKKIHQLPGVETQLDLVERIHTYGSLAAARSPRVYGELQSMELDISRTANSANNLCDHRVLCHNDLLRANRLLTREGILALDWEYAAMGDPYFDLAAICSGDGFNREQRERLLETYDELNEENHQRLALNLVLYDYVALLWWLATTDATEEEALAKLALMMGSSQA